MLSLFTGAQKYAIIVLLGLVLLLGASTVSYRFYAQHQATLRVVAEEQLQRTVSAMEDMRKLHEQNVEALTRSRDAQSFLEERRRTTRERIMISPDEDTPISPALRDAISNGVR